MKNKVEEIDLDNPLFQQAYRLLTQTDANVFLTGRAGTGKSTFLKYICKNIRKKYVILAPTGVAAVNVGGVTIHSFFQMPLRPVPPDDPDYSVSAFKNPKKFSRNKRKLLKEVELIIIDEVSMVRPDMIDFIDRALRGVTGKRGKPFGGVQLLLVGDIFQLEPVVNADTRAILSKYYTDFFFFNALAYKSANLVSVELNKIYRQTDPIFIELLDRVRLNAVTPFDINLLNSHKSSRRRSCEDEGFGITLTTRRDTASNINRRNMQALEGKEFIFQGAIEEDFPEKLLPTDYELRLKLGAQVMLIRNNKEKKWVNGTLAKISHISDTSISITLEDGREEKLEKETWENITYSYSEAEKKVKEEILGRFTQYPIRPAWALTIHKSQGLTFNNVSIDMEGGAFSPGQTYVALSRCRSLEGIHFLSPVNRRDVMVSHGAKSFSGQFNDNILAERLLKESNATRLSHEAQMEFEDSNFLAAVDKLHEVDALIGALATPSVRRLIASKLRIIETMRNQLSSQNKRFKELSLEFCNAGRDRLADANIKEAITNFEKAIELDKDNFDALLGLAECLAEEGEIKKSIALLDKLAKSSKTIALKALLLKGDLYEEEGDLSRAALAYIAAHKKDKDSIKPIERLISLYEHAGMEEEAQKYKDWLQA